MKDMKNEQKYFDKVVLVTGASRGIGRAISIYLLKNGANVIGFSKGEPTISNKKYYHFSVDIRDITKIKKEFFEISKKFAKVDVLINNAAVLTSQYSMIMPSEKAQEMVEVNLLGTFFISREVAKIMRKANYGRIINISSMASKLEPMGDSIYAACKAGVITLANVMAKEFSNMNITCNTLGITAIETDMLNQLTRDKIDKIIANLPIPRYACLDDIFNVIDFFASERSSYITAQTLFLGGIN